MKSQTPHKSLSLAVLLFLLLLGAGIWSINIIVQSSFPGTNLIPLLVRAVALSGLALLAYYFNITFARKNGLRKQILECKPLPVKPFLIGIILGFLLIAAIWSIIFLIYPFEIVMNTESNTSVVADLIAFATGNTLEELLFRGFLLLASIKLVGKWGAALLVSLLFGLFHLPGIGFTAAGLSMVLTTFTMSLLLIAVIQYTGSIWAAVTLHITGNLLLHTVGFDGMNNALF